MHLIYTVHLVSGTQGSKMRRRFIQMLSPCSLFSESPAANDLSQLCTVPGLYTTWWPLSLSAAIKQGWGLQCLQEVGSARGMSERGRGIGGAGDGMPHLQAFDSNVVLVSGVQHSDSDICTYIYTHTHTHTHIYIYTRYTHQYILFSDSLPL